MSGLRSYARLRRESAKTGRRRTEERAVNALVRVRSGGRCEVELDGVRCRRLADVLVRFSLEIGYQIDRFTLT